MLYKCNYRNSPGNFEEITISDLLILNKDATKRAQLLIQLENLYLDDNLDTPMVAVLNTTYPTRIGFRRKGTQNANSREYYRCEKESPSHFGNKMVLFKMNELKIYINQQMIKLYIKKVEIEKVITCNNNKYKVDLCYHLDHTEPPEYCDIWEGKLYFEVYHKCKVDAKQAVDFLIEGLPLFFLTVADTCAFDGMIDSKQYKSKFNYLFNNYTWYGVHGYMISNGEKLPDVNWRESNNNNQTARIGNHYTTIIKSKKNEGTFGIKIGDNDPLWDQNGQPFTDIEDTKRIAEYLSRIHYFEEKMRKI